MCGVDEKVLNLDYGDGDGCMTLNMLKPLDYFKWVNYMTCKLHLSAVIFIKKEKQHVPPIFQGSSSPPAPPG